MKEILQKVRVHPLTPFIIKLLIVLVVPFLLLSLVESLQRHGVAEYLIWKKENPERFMANYVLIFSLFAMLYILPKRMYFVSSLLLSTVITVAAYISMVKADLKGEPLTPLDFFLIDEARGIVGDYPVGNLTLMGLIAVIILMILIVIVFKLPKTKYLPWQHVSVFAVGLFLFSCIYYKTPIDLQERYKIYDVRALKIVQHQAIGFPISFALDVNKVFIEKPKNYGEAAIAAIQVPMQAEVKQPTSSERPNVIFWMSESFWDITQIERFTFNQDPLAYFHKLQQKHSSGAVLTNVYGGGTANTEFEVLTGMNVNFLPEFSAPYNQYLKNPVESLADVFKDNGYAATAIHPGENWFYRRNQVYDLFGFDRYVSGEFFINPHKENGRISDDAFVDTIIQQLITSPERDFIYGISIQNHSPYKRIGSSPIEVEISGKHKETSKQLIETYSQNLHDADLALKKLITKVEELGEPTVIVVFGDHLPRLKSTDETVRANIINYFPKDLTEYELYQMNYTTPLLIWDNIGLPKQDLLISPSYLGAFILEQTEQAKPHFWSFLLEQMKQTPLLPQPAYYDMAQIDQKNLNPHQLLVYDRLFGDGYSFELLTKRKTDFISGFEEQRVSEIRLLETSRDQSVYQIAGSGFTTDGVLDQSTQVLINNKVTQAKVVGPTMIEFSLPKTEKKFDVKTEVLDSKGNVIANSNVLNFNFEQ